MDIAAQVRSIETAARRLKAEEMRIDELERRRQTTASEIADAKRELVMMLAAGKGLLSLPPAEIAAAFEQLSLPKTTDAEEKDPGACDSTSHSMQLGVGQVANVMVAYTGYKGGPRVSLLQEIGLKRGGSKGFWSGLVDREGLDRLVQEFPNKVKINPIHSQSIPLAAEGQHEIGAAPERSEENFEGTAEELGPFVREKQGREISASDLLGMPEPDDVATQKATPAEEVQPIATAVPWPRPFSALPRRVVSNVTEVDGNEESGRGV